MHDAMECGEVLSEPVDSKFGVKQKAVTSVWVRPPQVALLRPGPNITLAVEFDIKP